VRAVGFLVGGIAYNDAFGIPGAGLHAAMLEAAGGPQHHFMNYDPSGLRSAYRAPEPWVNQTHHYAGILMLTYFQGLVPGVLVNWGREQVGGGEPGDVDLGTRAALHAYRLTIRPGSFRELGRWIREDLVDPYGSHNAPGGMY
jgi:hypothetical protein